jgi:DNA-binding NarL/FixJ family response regulator
MRDEICVLVADTYPLVRVGIRATLEQIHDIHDIKVVGEAKSETEILPLCLKLAPDVLLLDLGMNNMKAIATVTDIRVALPKIKIVILGDCNQRSQICSMIEENLDGYILKEDPPEDVVQSIRAVMRGEIWCSQTVMQQILAVRRDKFAHNEVRLNTREEQILTLVARGWNNAQIAAELGLAEQTVKNYLSSIYRSLNVSTRAEAIVWAVKNTQQTVLSSHAGSTNCSNRSLP